MNRTVRRLAALAALGTTVGVLAPVASASAATTPALPPGFAFPHTGFGFPVTGFGAFGPGPFVAPTLGQVAAVIGPTVITSAPSTFFNTNIQVSAGSNLSGGQAFP